MSLTFAKVLSMSKTVASVLAIGLVALVSHIIRVHVAFASQADRIYRDTFASILVPFALLQLVRVGRKMCDATEMISLVSHTDVRT